MRIFQLGFSLFAVLFAVPALAATVELAPSADTYVSSRFAAGNFGSGEVLFLENGTSPPEYSRSLLKFDLTSIPKSAVIESAVLTMFLQSNSTSSNVTIDLYKADSAWSEQQVTWDTKPSLGEKIQSFFGNKNSPQKWAIKDAVTGWVADPSSNYGVYVKSLEGLGPEFRYGYWSRESVNASVAPKLAITYASPALSLSGISAQTTASGATVSFATNIAATGTVEYGPTGAYGSSVQGSSEGTSHAIVLQGLAASTVYHYRVRAQAENGEVASEDFTFTTAAAGTPPAPPVIPSGTLVKSSETSAVYYVGGDGKRHAFPNEKIYFTWYADFSSVQAVSTSVLASLPLGANVTYRPGVKMVKFQTLPKVYAIGAKGELRWVQSEGLATALYGAAWNQKIDDLSDAFFVNYHFGADIASSADFNPAAVTAATPTIDQNF